MARGASEPWLGRTAARDLVGAHTELAASRAFYRVQASWLALLVSMVVDRLFRFYSLPVSRVMSSWFSRKSVTQFRYKNSDYRSLLWNTGSGRFVVAAQALSDVA